MTPTCDICGRPGVKHQQLRVELDTGKMGDVAFLAIATWPRTTSKTSLCYFCVREALLQLLKQSEKLQDAASVNPNPQDPICPANPTS